jgi:hypothetical protein
VSITRPIFGYREEHFAHDHNVRKFPYLARLNQDASSEAYITSNLPWLVADHPAEGTSCESWAAKEIGAEFVLGERELMRALGWDVMGRIRGPAKGAKRRILRLVSRNV